MKKFLLSAACVALAAGSAFADNLVVNGDFEDTSNLVRYNPWDWMTDVFAIDTDNGGAIKGWTINQNPWCVIVDIHTPEVDDEFIFEGNNQCLWMRRFDDNGWTWGGVEQVIKTEKGKTYTFGCLVAYREGTTVDWDHTEASPDGPEHGVLLIPCDAQGNEVLGGYPIEERNLESADYFQAWSKEFVADNDYYKIRLYHTNNVGEKNHSEGYWQQFDNVMVVTPEEYAAYQEDLESEEPKPNLGWMNAGVENVEGVEDNKILGIYNLNGVEMGKSLEGQKGIFVVRTAKGTQKVVLR